MANTLSFSNRSALQVVNDHFGDAPNLDHRVRGKTLRVYQLPITDFNKEETLLKCTESKRGKTGGWEVSRGLATPYQDGGGTSKVVA